MKQDISYKQINAPLSEFKSFDQIPPNPKYLIFKTFTKNINEAHDSPLQDKGYYFKFYNPTTDIKLIRFFLEDNGFIELSQNQKSYTTMNGNFSSNRS